MERMETHDIRALIALFPDRGSEQDKLYERYAGALARISPELLPSRFEHPFRDHVMAGVPAFDDLLARLEKEEDEMMRAAIVDALALIIENNYATGPVVGGLRALLAREKSTHVVSVAARALALAGDVELLETQRALLLSKSPSVVRMAARLIGWGRYERALPQLIGQLGIDRLSVADAVIWAIGRVRSTEALPTLHAILSQRVLTSSVLAALGEIGSAESIAVILPVLELGEKRQREAAAKAISRIALVCRGRIGTDAELERVRNALLSVLDTDASPLARYYALVAHGRLGGTIPEKRMMKAIGAAMREEDLDSLSAFFSRKSR